VVGRVGAGNDGLRLEHLDRHLVAGLRLDRTDQVLFEGQLVDHDQPLGRADHIDGPGVETLLEAQGRGAGRHHAYPRHALATPLDGAVAAQGAEPGDRVVRQRPPGEILDLHRHAAELDGRQPLPEPNADRPRGVGRNGKREDDCEG